jgi:hypothetical protein
MASSIMLRPHPTRTVVDDQHKSTIVFDLVPGRHNLMACSSN